MDRYLIPPSCVVKLADWPPTETTDCPGGKEEAEDRLRELNKKLESLQEMLYAQHKHRLLVVLQAMDTGGKDGVIRKVFEGVNPLGVKVASFKAPTPIELDHDYLWRVHAHTPAKGEIAIFNRSHYEDVLVVRVHELVAEAVWRRRYAQIRDFERLLSEEGTTICKFFLHISPEEQLKRLTARREDPTKRWKYNPADFEERKRWKDYQRAYEEAISETSADHAPWYIVPADKKWYRDLVIASVLVNTLEELGLAYP